MGVAAFLAAVGLAAAPADDLLELETRRRLYRLVVDYPGLHVNEIARQLGLEPNLAAYHVRGLQRHGLLSTRREAGYVRCFPRRAGRVGLQETLTAADKGRLAVLRRAGPLHIVLRLLREGELSLAQLARRTGLGRATLGYHVAHLEEAGLVRSERDGRERRCRLTDPAATLALLLRHRPPDALVRGFLETWQDLETGLQRGRRGESIL